MGISIPTVKKNCDKGCTWSGSKPSNWEVVKGKLIQNLKGNNIKTSLSQSSWNVAQKAILEVPGVKDPPHTLFKFAAHYFKNDNQRPIYDEVVENCLK